VVKAQIGSKRIDGFSKGMSYLMSKRINMRKLFFTLASASFLFVSCNNDAKVEVKSDTATANMDTMSHSGKMSSSDTGASMDHSTMDSATMMKNWMAYMTPGEVHKMMSGATGTWTADVSMWQNPNGPAEQSKATCVNKMILGGRYLEGTNTGMMMGQPFEGRSLTAYDNATKKFTNTWIDNMGTGIMVLSGTWDEANQTINLSGNMVDPSSTTGKEMYVRETLKMVDNDHQVMEMFGKGPDGSEMKMMHINYTRKK
jgi:hypothetical protein